MLFPANSSSRSKVRQYFHRYTDDALDLCDVLGSYVPGGKVKLDEVSKILGLTGKPEGIDGSRVEEMVRAGQIEEVARYCETDVLNTYRVWLVYELFRGAITADPLPGVGANPRIRGEPERRTILTCVRRSASRRVVTFDLAVAATERGEAISSCLLGRSCRLESRRLRRHLTVGNGVGGLWKDERVAETQRLSLLLPEGH